MGCRGGIIVGWGGGIIVGVGRRDNCGSGEEG